ncbi:MAG TPA: penicillin-binding protein 1C [Gemmatimonadales bacterium]|nr:penicillin-binding protein 1C [Gemmatimonadales bacterium]
MNPIPRATLWLTRRPILHGLAVAGLSGLAAFGAWVERGLPDGLLAPMLTQSLSIEDRHGLVLRTTRAADGSLSAWVSLERMDPDLPRAFVAVEDQRFFRHHGIDPRAVLRAIRDNLAHRRVVSGASTISMQLARLVHPVGHGAIDKLVQAAWALRLEAHLTKNQILEQYLNRVPLGQGAIGVPAAMRLYFNASAEQASLGQAALLAALARAPSSQNPLVAPSRAAARRSLGLQALQAQGYATHEEVERADREPLLGTDRATPFLAPHFTSRLLLWAENAGRQLAGTWRTSLDLGLQAALEDEVRHTVDQLADRGARQAAVVVLDNRNGQILAWVGSPDFWADTAGQVDMVVSPRQPGSALKPFLYALAFDRGATAATVLADIATTYQTSAGPYHPRNYDRRYHGPVRAREALASSYNVPAVELADRIGYATLLHGLQAAGFASLGRNPEYYGLGLALGNGDVTLLELANGYRALANGGMWTPTRWWADADAAAGGPGVRVVSERAAALALDILADPDARIPGFGLRTPFDWPFRVAAKTGTSRHFTDNWAAAVTQGFTVAVWVGNFSGRPMEGVSGVSGAGPLLHRAVLVTATRYPAGDLPRASDVGLIPVKVCRTSGLLASPECPTTTEYFMPGTAPDHVCDWHRGGTVHLPLEYAEWAATERDAAFAPEVQPVSSRGGSVTRLTIISPEQGDLYRIPPGVESRYASIALRAAGAARPEDIRWYVDGRHVGGPRWILVPGRHQIRAETGRERADVTIIVEQP